MSDAPSTEDGNSSSSSLGDRVEQVCDRAEAAWKAGRRPRIEDDLGAVPEPGRPVLLRALLELELDYRRRNGERPTPEEYHRRFPEHAAVIDAVFGAASPPRADRPGAGADHHLLFGLLALQNGFIDRDTLLTAFNAWVANKSQDLGQLLLERGAVDAGTHALLEALARKHLALHGDDPERSLAALSSLGSARATLEQVADPELQASLTHVATDPAANHDRGEATGNWNYAAGASSSAGNGTRFRILRPHARGGLGEIYVARDEELKREVALKEIQGRYADDVQSRARFVLEAEVTGRLEHPGIVPVYGLGTYGDGRPFYAMRFIKGDSLKEAIARFHEAESPGRDPGERLLALQKLLRRFLDVCNAVAYAHSRGVLHRDLKPGNVMLGPYGETLVVDWGLAKAVGRAEGSAPSEEKTLRPEAASGSADTLPGDQLGTPEYMSPEQAAGRVEQLGVASDVYSLGATLYCLLTGKAPFEGRDPTDVLQKVQRGEFPRPRQVDRAIDPALEAICVKAMALRPEDRYATPRHLAEDLDRWLADEPVSARREGLLARVLRQCRRRPVILIAVILFGIIDICSILIILYLLMHFNLTPNNLWGSKYFLAIFGYLLLLPFVLGVSAQAGVACGAAIGALAGRIRRGRVRPWARRGALIGLVVGLAFPPMLYVLSASIIYIFETYNINYNSISLRSRADVKRTFENLDFESGDVGGPLVGWVIPKERFPAYVAACQATITDDNPARGERCARAHLKSQGPMLVRGGVLGQSFDATPYRGKFVRLRGALRIDAATAADQAFLWLRVDRPNLVMGFFDNMHDRPVRMKTWAYYDIVGKVAEDAEAINIGLLMYGKGTVWLDDLTFEVVGDFKPMIKDAARDHK